jgi:N-sulfoglucosamine sulfohydrolase
MDKTFRILLLPALLLFFSADAAAQRKPNIIVFISDDQQQQDVGCYGNTDVRTPNMDRLAAQGMKFTRAYAASPMCTPSRSALFTGLYPFRNGSQMNHFSVQPGVKSLPHYLQPLGYRVVLSGKTHISPAGAFPFEYIGEKFGRYEPIEERVDKDKETVRFIQQHFSEHPDQPLCLFMAVWLPHVPWMPNRDFDPARLKVPPYLADTRETREALAAYYQSISTTDEVLGEVLQAVERSGQQDNTVFMFVSDQGPQFPGAKWTVYDRGLRVPLIVRWPKKIKAGAVSDALISLTDITPTLVNLAGGKAPQGLDGKSFAGVLQGGPAPARPYIFAETSMEPHYWYHYTPARSVITADGYHYIRNYSPGTKFITHIDRVERNYYYFGSWEASPAAARLLNRYSYRPPEELYYLPGDAEEMNNLASQSSYNNKLATLQKTLDRELTAQGETTDKIVQGQLPVFYDRMFEVKQHTSPHTLSFNKSVWSPDTLYCSAYVKGLDKSGVLLKYFNRFRLSAKDKKLTLLFAKDRNFESPVLNTAAGHLVMRLTAAGDFVLWLNGETLLKGNAQGDYTKTGPGYLSCGFDREGEPASVFPGEIANFRFYMNSTE